MHVRITTFLFVSLAPALSLAQTSTPPATKFLTPLSRSLVLPPDDPRVIKACPASDSRYYCPKFLRYGSPAGGPGPFIPPVFKADAPNILVTFTLQDVKNELVAGAGIDSDDAEVNLFFAFDSSASSVESPPGPGANPPDPGPYTTFLDFETSPGVTADVNAIIWQALIINGCNTPPPIIPISFLNMIDVSGEGGMFQATDNTSLTSTGFWNFQYSAMATNTHGHAPERYWDRSRLTFRGKVSVICTGLQEF